MNTLASLAALLRLDQHDFWPNKRYASMVGAIVVAHLILLSGLWSSPSWAVTDEPDSPEKNILEIPLPEGNYPRTLKFPLYEQQNIQYFSAGLGKEERSLTYPPYPLKLVFIQGKGAYLAGVSVDVATKDGKTVLSIPGDHVQGPWLFMNIPTGTYVVRGTNSRGRSIEKTVIVRADSPTVAHFQWP